MEGRSVSREGSRVLMGICDELAYLCITQRPDDSFRQVFVYLAVPGHGLKLSRFVIGIPVVFSAVAYKLTAKFVELLDELIPLHTVTTNSSTFFT